MLLISHIYPFAVAFERCRIWHMSRRTKEVRYGLEAGQ